MKMSPGRGVWFFYLLNNPLFNHLSLCRTPPNPPPPKKRSNPSFAPIVYMYLCRVGPSQAFGCCGKGTAACHRRSFFLVALCERQWSAPHTRGKTSAGLSWNTNRVISRLSASAEKNRSKHAIWFTAQNLPRWSVMKEKNERCSEMEKAQCITFFLVWETSRGLQFHHTDLKSANWCTIQWVTGIYYQSSLLSLSFYILWEWMVSLADGLPLVLHKTREV